MPPVNNDPNFITPITNPFGLTNVGGYAKPTFADIDNDGDLDAFVGNNPGNTLFYRNTGTAAAPTFTQEATNPFGLTNMGNYAVPTFADIDGDGDLDAFVGNYFGNTLFYRNTGTAAAPTFTQEATNPFGLTTVGRYAAPTFADIDNDGDLDAFVGNANGNTLFYRNTGTAAAPTFTQEATNPFGLTNVGNTAAPTLADIDGDGDLDAFVGNRNGDTLFYRNTGTAAAPTFTPEATNPFGLTDVGYFAAPTFADIDGDGDLDAFVGDQYGNILFFENVPTSTAPTVSITAQTATANEGGSNGVYRLTRTDTTGDLTINLTLDGSSTASTADYTLSGGSVTVSGSTLTATIAAGQSFVDINLAAFDDIAAEADETLKLNLDTGTGYTVDGTNNTATVTIAANDTVVTNTNDSGEGSLRQAILNANANAGADTITFAGSVFTDATPDTITLTSGQLVITDALTINGLGASNLSISGNNASAVFKVDDSNSSNQIDVAINGLTITAGKDDSAGGGIFNRENLTLSNNTISSNTGRFGGIYNEGNLSLTGSTVSNNTGSVTGSVGGIINFGTFTLTNSTVSGNTGVSYGGISNQGTLLSVTGSTVSNNTTTSVGGAAGIGQLSGTLNLINSTVSGNTSAGNSGGILNISTANLTNSTISGNRAAENGGGILNIGTLNLNNSTITNNTADSDNNSTGDGGGISVIVGTVTAKNTIIAGNFDSGNQAPDIKGAVTGNANNLIGSLTGASGSIGTGSDITFASAGITNINQVIGSLANNGGATQTHAIISGSAAINAGDNTLISSGVTTDQRGITRTIGGNVDIGAYESPFIPPVAANDTATTDENTAVNINVLGNDTDANGDSLSVIKVNGNSVTVSTPITLASGALLTLNANGTFNYNPNSQFESLGVGATASDSFTYTASDNGNGGTSTATVNLTINGVNDAPVGSPTATLSNTAEDTAITITAANLLAGFSDVDAGDTLSVVNLTATNGALVNNNNGTYTFTPTANFNGAVNLSYGVSDGTVTLAGQTRSFSVTPVNDAPVGSPTATLSNTAEDTAITITAANLLAGFSDVDAGDTLSVVNLTATNGALVNNNNGTYTFTPTANFNGAVNLSYGVSDGTVTLAGQTRSFSVTPVNDAPVGSPTATLSNTAEDTAITITAANLLAGFSDVDAGDTLSVVNLTATNGALVNNNNGTYTFTPTANFNGAVNLSYGVSDGTVTLAGQTRSFSVTPVNDAPVGSPTATLSNTAEDTAITITAANLLAGFSDVDAGDTLSVVNLTATNGALVNNNNGTYTFTPTANFNGAVNLTYGVSDGTVTLAGQTRSFSVTPVNDAPVGVNDSATTAFNTAVTIQTSTLLANDTDVDSTFLSITGVSGFSNGTAVLNNNGTANNTADDYIVFTPTTGFSGDASFNYTLSDGSLTGSAAVTVAVGADITGTNKADYLVGTNGNDIIDGGNSNDIIYGGGGNDNIFGGNGNDVLYGDGFMDGGSGNDNLYGGNGNDTLYGGSGNDNLYGGNGNDLLYGGLGSDFLTGDNGNDTFAFAAGEGTDTITDFNKGNDKIGLYGGLSFGQLSFSGSNIRVTSTNEILATLTGINTTTLIAADFVTL